MPKNTTLESLEALEILDSRGQPTVQVEVHLSNGMRTVASVPSGASTGAFEAVELRDEEPDRYHGRGVLAAVGSVRRQISDRLTGMPMSAIDDVLDADEAIRQLDGTDNLARLGANAALGVSLALVRAVAATQAVPVWSLLAGHLGGEARLPVPHFNVINGGAHASTRLAFQEFMIAPVGSPSFAEALRAGAEIYAALRDRLHLKGIASGLGDEGGFAVPYEQPEEVLWLIVHAIEDAGYQPGRDGVAIALDPAANGFRTEDGYEVGGNSLSSDEMVRWYSDLVIDFPIWSIEDGLAENDTAGWQNLTKTLGERIQIVGDDIFVTDSARVRAAADQQIGNACLIKPNQIGSVSETLATIQTCRSLGYAQMVSHRSGETIDTFIADLAVGAGCGQIKSGATARGERLAKYNRLLEIEHHSSLPYGVRDADKRP